MFEMKLNFCYVNAADTLGFTAYPPAYLSPEAKGRNLLIGANFASAGSGYDDHTAINSVKEQTFQLCFGSAYFKF